MNIQIYCALFSSSVIFLGALKLEDNPSNQEILTHKDNYILGTDTRTAKGRHSGAHGRVIFELIGGSQKNWGAKQILLSVCDGYFVKHPNKTYY